MCPVDSVRRELCVGQSEMLSVRCIKERDVTFGTGDVVTRNSVCARMACCRGRCSSARYKTMQPIRRLLKHLTSGGFGGKFSKTQAPVPVRRDGAYSNNPGKRRINLAKTFSCDNLAIVAEF